jgi:hypothetical protein
LLSRRRTTVSSRPRAWHRPSQFSGVLMKPTSWRLVKIPLQTVIWIAGVCVTSGAIAASAGQIASVDERVRAAERVVVATARSVTPEWRENAQGDRIIVSRIQLDVNETLKGAVDAHVWVEVDGGSLDGLTLQVSGLPLIQPGERAVFFLDSTPRGVHTPHLRGQGILMLDDQNLVRGTRLRLDEIRSRARRARR